MSIRAPPHSPRHDRRLRSICVPDTLLTRLFVGLTAAFILSVAVITLLLSVLGHYWLIALVLAVIWSICLVFLVFGLGYVLFPVSAVRFQERLRSAYPQSIAAFGRSFDRSFGFDIDPKAPSVARARLLGGLVAVMMLSVGIAASWILIASLDH